MTDTAPKKVLCIPNNDATRDLIADIVFQHLKKLSGYHPAYASDTDPTSSSRLEDGRRWLHADHIGFDGWFSTFDLADAVMKALQGMLD